MNSDVEDILGVGDAIDALRIAYTELARGDAAYVPRIDMFAPTASTEGVFQWGSMAGVSIAAGVAAVRMKSDVVHWPDGKMQEKYCLRPGLYCGLILLFRLTNGEPAAIIQDGYLQHIRVGASAGIGVDLLARQNAETVGLLGSGGMAEAYLRAIVTVREVRHVNVYSPSAEHRYDFAQRMCEALAIEVVPVSRAEDAVRDVDIVATATDSMVPTFDSNWLSPGTHVVCVTRRELSPKLVETADVGVQLGVHSIEVGAPIHNMEWKAGGFAAYVAGGRAVRERIPTTKQAERVVLPSLDQVLRGECTRRTDPTQITLFVNTGTQGLQFAAVGGRALDLAEERDVGTLLPREWFLQDIRD